MQDECGVIVGWCICQCRICMGGDTWVPSTILFSCSEESSILNRTIKSIGIKLEICVLGYDFFFERKYMENMQIIPQLFCYNSNVMDCEWLFITYTWIYHFFSLLTLYHITVVAKKLCNSLWFFEIWIACLRLIEIWLLMMPFFVLLGGGVILTKMQDLSSSVRLIVWLIAVWLLMITVWLLMIPFFVLLGGGASLTKMQDPSSSVRSIVWLISAWILMIASWLLMMQFFVLLEGGRGL